MMRYGLLLGLIIGLICAAMLWIVGLANAETGPSASDVKAAMVRSGISAGASFELGGHTYTLHDIYVSKTGPQSFVVSFITK